MKLESDKYYQVHRRPPAPPWVLGSSSRRPLPSSTPRRKRAGWYKVSTITSATGSLTAPTTVQPTTRYSGSARVGRRGRRSQCHVWHRYFSPWRQEVWAAALLAVQCDLHPERDQCIAGGDDGRLSISERSKTTVLVLCHQVHRAPPRHHPQRQRVHLRQHGGAAQVEHARHSGAQSAGDGAVRAFDHTNDDGHVARLLGDYRDAILNRKAVVHLLVHEDFRRHVLVRGASPSPLRPRCS